MLCQLSINNFAIVRFLELDFKAGMTSITGETGAGKSIAIDALGLCLGNRADANTVRPGANKAEVSARFTIDDVPFAKRWLEDNDLDVEDECILRRTISADGRSRAYINGNPVPLSQLKTLGQLFVGIHGQHAHHAMLKSEHQLTLLDSYANHKLLLDSVTKSYQRCKNVENELKQLQQNQQERIARKQLVQYQVEELDEFALIPGEFEQIEQEHKRLANGTDLIESCQSALQLLSEDDEHNIESLLNRAVTVADSLQSFDPTLKNIAEMLNEALIQVQESTSEVQDYLSRIELDPEHFAFLEQRISKAMQLARKHHVQTEYLAEHHGQLKAELSELSSDASRLDEIQQQLDDSKLAYIKNAQKLSQSRQRYAKELNKLVTQSIHELNMPKGKFNIAVNFNPESQSLMGSDQIEFQVTTNPGQPLQPIAKVASGGELSRIGLGIQVITARKVSTPTLIFDEVDVGISGPTAAVVGRMLRSLGESTQVICVTHLPQVAGNGHQHMLVNKFTKSGGTETQMKPLDKEQRISELARLLAGDVITENALANARELLH
ncbi:DNA repair protein RecN [Shewanella sp. 1_MG-2023]|uniref:DNA repair protein RecN n=1 Tax=unclassified Shewanella TaxID=196818 RepID=UPI000C839526|nr:MULTISPECIES: DNA repair protein RecN [unclassified Shewanella]MCC4832183.1 DNA repair protein RecN [Shewanella sp. 10N.7]MDO6610276.1 DNA repair protein RecN [Shewanella sp. 7_MG-2023]MDO6770401.1 DNA repair protein RecN [Shewanella sp. 2_MG-2023]MDO6795901.1 DNA repair protein RecN [Shewanella sp. 1_MG-2023]PMG78822.1 DNA repair protein RecN [Shewanella sp. 10N.286.51.B7]